VDNAYPNPNYPAPQFHQGGFGGADGYPQYGGYHQAAGGFPNQAAGGFPHHGGVHQPVMQGLPIKVRWCNKPTWRLGAVGHLYREFLPPAREVALSWHSNSKLLPPAREGPVVLQYPPARTNLSPRWRWVHLREEEHHKEAATHQQTRLQQWWLIMQTQKLQKHQG
jgi:hypothetical protein